MNFNDSTCIVIFPGTTILKTLLLTDPVLSLVYHNCTVTFQMDINMCLLSYMCK